MMILPALLLALAQDAVDPAQVVATVLGRKITAGDIGWKSKGDLAAPPAGTCGTDHPVWKLQALVWKDVARHYLQAKRLEATPEELRELAEYSKRFEEKDRKRRAKDLAEVEEVLRDPALSEEKRRESERRRDTLRSLKDFDRQREELERAQPEESAKARAEVHRLWVEASKMDNALYKEFGGVVSITKFGQVPVGARAALLRRYEKEGKLDIPDESLSRPFWSMGEAPPRSAASPGKVDLRPYWKLD